MQNYYLKIFVNSSANVSYHKPQMSFGYGWNAKVSKSIKNCGIAQITEEMAKRGIEADFAGNKVVAWCSEQAIKIFEHLNDRYGLKLDLPKAIFVEDFSKLNIDQEEMKKPALCNWLPSCIVKDTDKVFSERTIFFNSFEKKLLNTPEEERWRYLWENVDPYTEELYKHKCSSSPHFMSIPLHEFFHSAQNGHLLKKLTFEELHEKLQILTSPDFLSEFQKNCGKIFSNLGENAIKTPLETIANCMCKLTARSLNPITLLPTYNPFKHITCFNNSIMAKSKTSKAKNNAFIDLWNGANKFL